MATKKKERAYARKVFEGFGGMGSEVVLSGEGARDVCNFRILADGTLRTREGYRMLTYFPTAPVSAVWQGSLGGTPRRFAVSGSAIYTVDAETFAVGKVGDLSKTPTRAAFCAYGNTLYLFSGNEIMVFRPEEERFEAVAPYVPLYGLNWHPSNYGEVYEPINLLTPRLRVHYYNNASATVFQLPYYASAVERVLCDGAVCNDYTFLKGSDYVTLTSAPTYVEICFRVELNTETREDLFSSLPYRLSGDGKETLVLWGGRDACRLYPSREVDAAMCARAELTADAVDPLYFAAEDVLFAGDKTHPVGAVVPFLDGALAMSEDHTWLLSRLSDGTVDLSSVGAFGCRAGAAIPYEGGVATVSRGGIHHLTAPLSRPERISRALIASFGDGVLPARLSEDPILFLDPFTEEIWLRDRGDENGEVRIYNGARKTWFRFDGVPASLFFSGETGVGFAAGNVLYRFEKDLCTDDGNSFTATYQSTDLDFGIPEQPRRTLRASLAANTRGAAATLTLQSEREVQVYPLSGKTDAAFAEFASFRFRGHRHRFLRVSLSATGTSPASFYKLLLETNL